MLPPLILPACEAEEGREVGGAAGGEVAADWGGGRGGSRFRVQVAEGWGFLWLPTIEEGWESRRTGGGGGAACGEGEAAW
jgi:hypothetical protein